MKRPIKYKGKEITIYDFTPVIPWEQIEQVLGKRNYANFCKWMQGQTVMEAGCYGCDLKAWLTNGINFD